MSWIFSLSSLFSFTCTMPIKYSKFCFISSSCSWKETRHVEIVADLSALLILSFICAHDSWPSNRCQLRVDFGDTVTYRMGTDLIQSNTSARTVQDILGHTSYQQSAGCARSSGEGRKTAIENRKLS